MDRQNQRKRFESDREWFCNNLSSIREKYPKNHFVAIKDKKVLASAIELKELKEFVIKQGEDPDELVMDLIYPERFDEELKKEKFRTRIIKNI